MSIYKVCLLFFTISIVACHYRAANDSTLNSIDIDSKEKRLITLKKYVDFKSDVLDCEFDLFNVNGFDNDRLSVPGASSWDYKFCATINRNEVIKWTKNLKDTTFNIPEYDWILNLIKHRPENWSLHSVPKFYIGNSMNDILVVYEQEGTIFRHIINP